MIDIEAVRAEAPDCGRDLLVRVRLRYFNAEDEVDRFVSAVPP